MFDFLVTLSSCNSLCHQLEKKGNEGKVDSLGKSLGLSKRQTLMISETEC